ncbi:MAG: SMC-Scp complex subunit ScpB [Bacteroidetes bacterium QH_8_67_23]|jgi:segregation and condensation protein B|nr:MAG: SMC-Scp complex subunit ScpB [Bacteroidetes bacterium QH_8_67_23]
MESGAPARERPRPQGNERAPEEEQRLTRAVEALIFAADEPLGAGRIADVFAEVTGRSAPEADDISEAVERINAAYVEDGRPFRIEEWAGGFQMATHEEWAPFIKTLLAGPRQQSLSRSLSETLAVVAYRQPVTRPEVDFIRGVSADYALRKLMELELIDVQGRSDSLGRPLLYGTTEHFLEEFGLADLDDLPSLREVEELLDDPNFNEERAKLLQLRREDEAGGANGPSAGNGESLDAEASAREAASAQSTTGEEAGQDEAEHDKKNASTES